MRIHKKVLISTWIRSKSRIPQGTMVELDGARSWRPLRQAQGDNERARHGDRKRSRNATKPSKFPCTASVSTRFPICERPRRLAAAITSSNFVLVLL
jgi:hypothetical protein